MIVIQISIKIYVIYFVKQRPKLETRVFGIQVTLSLIGMVIFYVCALFDKVKPDYFKPTAPIMPCILIGYLTIVPTSKVIIHFCLKKRMRYKLN